ncbi:family 43 glycosylhydrolase [Bacteroides sp. 51]|uniref:family 43 glycosylhydrolase n=1 Tax=Bacteroides sp. 51 TaxID=2302938 RepID=UPI0013CFD3C0|nr:family 43 glycosylhydrolase [Bacteroides sp. 51]NDV83977.1 glycoside hydrolase [Bacteroides sp. 51]
MFTPRKLILPLVFACFGALSAQNINNPVLPGVADAGVIKHNGTYYIGGVNTNGDFYSSTDLVNWAGPFHVIDMDNEWTAGTGAKNNQIHANDMIYLNGTFHLYWSVNHWGKDKHIVHIAHAESSDILGPYHEPVKDQWMDNRIDPQVFKDDDGKLYMYMVRFTDGNTIWVRPMKDPRTFDGHPIYLFASLPGTWETMDNRVAEGPWVIKYRNRYYMMYNANHTSTEYGNYQLGVAEADSPTSFNNGNKYSYPLLHAVHTADGLLFSPGQPNILRGPNGFEWWLIYMANKNQDRRGQYINRIYFHNKTMHADGITASQTEGYYPEPTKATYACTEEFSLQANSEKLLTNEATPATSYLFEAGIKTASTAGVIAWWKDKNNWIKVGLEAPASWYVQQCRNGESTTQTYALPQDFKFGVYHKISVERNVTHFSFRIDDIPAPGASPVLETNITGKGIPGLFSGNGSTAFNGLLYTIGWDEFDDNITGWDNMGTAPLFKAFKGDMLSQYEFSLQVANEAEKGKVGAYPVYINEDNYILASLDFDKQHLTIERMEKGKAKSPETFSLADWKTQYADIKYTDFIEKGYTFNYPVWMDGIQLNRQATGEEGVFIDNMFDKLSVEYKIDNGKWLPAPIAQIQTTEDAMYNEVVFEHPIKTDALRFINKDPQDERVYIYKIRTKELFKTSYNLRFVKKEGQLYVFVDGNLITRMKISNTPSQVGIYAENATPSFNGMMLYHIPE